ncbi:MAG: site-specific DNA-methyltransferase, partial [Gammaproteobacteria bacterium]|nr:site-specific DNA-methyltransferase [Gammaproteobacteria bacterium]
MFISKDQRLFTHAIHKYPAKFFPELPRWIIEKYSTEGELILDPFMGSGTTNLEASLLGRNSIGVDVDPFSRFISSVKTTLLNKEQLAKAHETLESRISEYCSTKLVNGIPSFPYRDNWFKPYILKELAYISTSIESLNHTRRIKDFFLVCFSSIIRSVSEADNNCTRTVIRKKLNKKVNEGDAISL